MALSNQTSAETRLEETEKRFKALIEHGADAVSLMDAKGIVLYESPSYQRIMGYPVESRLGKNTFELVHPEDLKIIQKLFVNLLQNPEPVSISPVRVRHGDGSWHWIEGVANNMLTVPAVGAIVINFRDITDRKRTEEALRRSEEKFRSITEQTRDLICITDLQGTIIFASGASKTLFLIDSEDMCGKQFMDFLDPSVIPRAVDAFKYAVSTGERIHNLELTMKRKDGTCFIGELNGSDYRHGDQKGTLVVIRDITERKYAELALKESETRMRLLSDNLPGGMVYQVDSGIDGQQRRFTYVSAGVRKLHGVLPEEALADASVIYHQIFEQDQPLLEKMEAAAVAGQTLFNVEVRVKMPSGDVRWSYFSSCPRRLSNNHLIWDGIEIDITERKKNENELKKSHIIHQMITENVADVLWTYSIPRDKFSFVSDSVFALRGFTPEEILNQSLKDSLSPEAFENITRILAEKTAQRRPGDTSPVVFKTEVTQPCKDGRLVATEVVTTTIFDAEGNPVEVLGITRDITEKIKLLESAQRADKLEAIGLLAGGIAHDFNNLLGGIYGNIDLASSVSKEPQVGAYLERTKSSMARARALTQQLLTFSKGGAPIRKIEQLTPFLQDAAHFALSGSNVSCVFEISSKLWPCNFDKNQIGQVIDNLVINAQQAMPLGGTITVSAENVVFAYMEHLSLSEGRYVKISIEDHGIGIPKQNLSRIFDPFFTTKTRGHGLGLATCYSIMNRHNGCIEVESDLGLGSIFHLFLPASSEKALPPHQTPSIGHKGKGMVIVMDDEAVIRTTVGTMLKMFGYSVELLENGREAIDFFKKEIESGGKIAAMFFDLTIAGGMGGKEAIREIRSIDKDVPVFVASGYAADPVMANPAEYGFTASICKPFTFIELAGLLNEYFNS